MSHFISLPSSETRRLSGRERQIRRRDLARSTKRADRARRKNFFAALQEDTRLRTRLEAVGLSDLPLAEPDPDRAYRATIWLIAQFAPGEGEVQVTEELVRDAFRRALNAHQHFLGVAPTDLPTDYELPVRLA